MGRRSATEVLPGARASTRMGRKVLSSCLEKTLQGRHDRYVLDGRFHGEPIPVDGATPVVSRSRDIAETLKSLCEPAIARKRLLIVVLGKVIRLELEVGVPEHGPNLGISRVSVKSNRGPPPRVGEGDVGESGPRDIASKASMLATVNAESGQYGNSVFASFAVAILKGSPSL